VHQLRRRDALGACGSAALALVFSACGTPTSPKPPTVELAVQSISPTTGPAAGGTDVTIRGVGFATGTSVTIGGRAATEVTVRGSDMITAKTPASSIAGAVDIAVLLNGRTGTLAGGFRYEVSTNTPPTIKSIVAQGKRLRQPSNFGDFGETLTVTATVEDAQTTPAALTYQWHACGGTFTGTGSQVEWKTPASGALPSTCTVEVIVSDGPRVVTGSVGVRLHNSATEVAAFALEFLEEFADSMIPAELTVRNFSNSCPGKADELKDVEKNRKDYRHVSHTYGPAKTTIAFGSMCKTKTADACVITPVEWRSIYIPTGELKIAAGISIISGVYRDSRWWLCDSLADDAPSLNSLFVR
jgi:hypothetical protein